MNETNVTLFNTGLPILIIGVLAAVLPLVLTPWGTRSQGRVLVSVGGSVLVLIAASAAVFALFDMRGLLGGDTVAKQGAAVWMYLRVSRGAVIVWAPVLAFVWLYLAQRVERLKGRDIVRGEG